MEQTIDARGDACPLPVVKAKKALSNMESGILEVLVDNETAVHNLEKLAENKHCACSSERLGEKEFAVRIEASNASDAAQTPAAAGDRVVVISSATMGSGDDELGYLLMKGFVFALTQLDELPSTILLYNGGVNLSCEGSPALDDLRALETAGVEIMSCGTCLNHYGLTDKLAVGEATNMYVIVEKQMNAAVIVRP